MFVLAPACMNYVIFLWHNICAESAVKHQASKQTNHKVSTARVPHVGGSRVVRIDPSISWPAVIQGN